MESRGPASEPHPRPEPRRALVQMCRELLLAPHDAATHRRCARQLIGLGPALEFPVATLGDPAEGVVELLVTGGVVNPARIATHAALVVRHRFKLDAELGSASVRVDFERLAADDLFMELLASTPIPDFHVEAFVAHIRRALLDRYRRRARFHAAELKVALAVAQQAFLCEYLADESVDEHESIAALVATLSPAAISGRLRKHGHTLAIIGCYRPLHELAEAESIAAVGLLSWPAMIRPLIREQVLQPLAERRASAQLAEVTPIVRQGSQDVAAHYEDHPFPRWSKLYPRTDARTYDVVGLGAQREPHPILVPGCGSGQHALELARTYPQSLVWAVDLSRASLAHGQRIARQMGIRNVRFMLGDLLELPGHIEQRFQHIDCMGVLHHLEHPSEGWEALHKILAPGGTLRVAVYGELARLPIKFLRDEIARLELRPVPEDMKFFRRRLAEDPRYRGMARSFVDPAWHSVSELRDTLFHGCEHRYRLEELEQQVADLDLELIRFRLPTSEMAERYHERYPDDPECRSWANWLAFEREYLGTLAMFELVVRRPQ